MSDESRIEKRKKERQKGGDDDGSEFWSYVALAVIIGVVVVVSYFLFFSGGAAADVEPWNDVKELEGAEDPTMIAADASENEADEMVEVVYYGDFACPICANFERNSFPRLKDEYIATGDVKFVFKPLDVLSQQDPNSRPAALGAHAVWENNASAYWMWHRTMFANQDPRRNWATPSSIGEFASEAGADGDSVEQSIRQREYATQIQRHRSQADEAGVTGTPTFVVNNTLVTGDSYTELTSEIESELDG